MKNTKCSRIYYASIFVLLLIIFIPPLSAADIPSAKLPDAPKAPKLKTPKAPKIKTPELGLKTGKEVVVITDTQDAYDALPEITPAVCMLDVSAASAIPESLQKYFADQINRIMTQLGMFKPVSMQKWLVSQYGIKKSRNVFALMNDLKAERYSVLLDGICKPYIFKEGEWYVMCIELMPFKMNGFPLMSLRIFNTTSQIPEMTSACINDLGVLYNNKDWSKGKKRIAFAPFKIECRKMVGQKNGDFEYIPTSFSEQSGVTIHNNDDYFSRLFAYVFTATGMFSCCSLDDIPEYTGSEGVDSSCADYLLKGRIQMTDEVNIYYIDFIDLHTNTTIRSVHFFSSDFSLVWTWKIIHDILSVFCGDVIGKDSFGYIPTITAPSEGFYMDDMFVGWDTIEELPVSKGKHRISAGTYAAPYASDAEMKKNRKEINDDSDIRNFFVYVDAQTWLFKGKNGEYVWNLLGK